MNDKTKIIGSSILVTGLIAGAVLLGGDAEGNSTFKKIDDKTIEVTKTIPETVIPAKEEKHQYNIQFLLDQKERVYQDYDNNVAKCEAEIATRQAEKDEVDELLSEAKKLGIE